MYKPLLEGSLKTQQGDNGKSGRCFSLCFTWFNSPGLTGKKRPRIKTLELYFLFGFSQLMNMEVYATKIIKTSSDNYEPTGYSTTIE